MYVLAGLRKTKSGNNAEMGGIMLQKDQHDRGERDHPQKLIAIPRTGGNVRSPVPGIDKTDRDQKSRTNVLKKI